MHPVERYGNTTSMSDLWICSEIRARKPFVPAVDKIKLYTIEELCFYLYQNVEHLDEEVMNDVLYQWLETELMQPKLASILRQEQAKGQDASWCVWVLLNEVGMYTSEEMEEIRQYCFVIKNLDGFERCKLKADRLFRNGKYTRSILEYRALLELMPEDEYEQLKGNVWHNLGVAYTRLFMFTEATRCFKIAYEKNGNEKSKQAYEEALYTPDTGVEIFQTFGMKLKKKETDWKVALQDLQKEYRRNAI